MLSEKPVNSEQKAVAAAFKEVRENLHGFDAASALMDNFMSSPEMQIDKEVSIETKPV